MVRKNRLVNSIGVYFLLGAIVGAIVGGILVTVFAGVPSTQLEARVMLFRVPSGDSYLAARDYVAAAVSRPKFLERFIAERNIDSNAQASLENNLTVTARDPASPNAELRLVGTDEKLLTKTLDELAIYVTETLRTIDKNEMQSLQNELENEIDSVSAKNLQLLDVRDQHEPIPERLKKDLQLTADLAGKRKSLELSLRYVLKPHSGRDEQEIKTLLKKVVAAEEKRENQAAASPEKLSEDYRFALSLAKNSAVLQALRQAKQRLVIEFNRDTPLRIASRAKVEPIEIEPASITILIPICAFLGALIAGILWSIQRNRDSKLTGLAIEERFGIPTLAVIPQTLVDAGQQHGVPIATMGTQADDLTAIRSLHVAISLLDLPPAKNNPIIFSEIDADIHAGHVIANLALDIAGNGAAVLVIDAQDRDGRLKQLFSRAGQQAWASVLSPDDLANNSVNKDASDSEQNKHGSLYYVRESDEWISNEKTALFDRILVLAPTPDAAKKLMRRHEHALGVVLCTADTRMSQLRRALFSHTKGTQGAVLCGSSS